MKVMTPMDIFVQRGFLIITKHTINRGMGAEKIQINALIKKQQQRKASYINWLK